MPRCAHRAFHILAAAAVVLWALLPPARGNPRNVLTNGGFEDGTTGWELDPDHERLTDGAAAHSGRACVTGSITGPNQALTLRQTVRVSARNLYRFGIWARATNNTKLVLWATQPGARARTMVTAWESVPDTWRHYEVPLSVQGDGDLVLQIISPSSYGAPAGRIRVDDVTLHATALPDAQNLSGTRGFADEPDAVIDGAGHLFTVWNSFRDGQDDLRVTRWTDAEGEGWRQQGSWRVAGGPEDYVMHPHLVPKPNGSVVLFAREAAENDWTIHVIDLGTEGPGEPCVLDRGPGIATKPRGAILGDALHVAWETNAAGTRSIAYTTVRDGRAGGLETVSEPSMSSYCPDVTVLQNGTAIVAWHSFQNHNYDLYLRRRGPGGAWGPIQRLTTAPGIDRHPRLAVHDGTLWLVYEHTAAGNGYRIGATNRRHCVVARILPNGSLETPAARGGSPLAARCEAATPAFDDAGRLWIAHLRPRLPRAGWDTFVTAFTGTDWTTPRRVSPGKGMDRPAAVIPRGDRLLIIGQQDDLPETWSQTHRTLEARSTIAAASLDVRDAPLPTPFRFEPLVEPDTASDAANLRVARGEDRDTPVIEYRGRELKLYYGDLHEHSDVSVCNRVGDQTIDESYQHMRDIASLDFACVTDHGYNLNPYLWNRLAKMARTNCDPGRFLTFLGEEWTSSFEEYSDKHPYGYHGHRNLILADTYFPRWWNAKNGQTPAEVWQELREMNANFVHIPHQIADTGNVPCNWDFTDEVAQPVAEIFQTRGSYEYKGAPREAGRSTPAGYFIQDAWARGIVIGVIASPDHGGGRGKACVYAPELTREAILDALRARHCFGTTAARMVLDVRVNGHLMGEKIPAADGRPVEVTMHVDCPAPIERVEVCRNNTFVYSHAPGGAQADLRFIDTSPLDEPSYYYVRVIQTDGEIGWSSPVWLGYD